MVAKKTKILSQKGQGLIEFLLFVPFMLMMYSVVLTISNSLNASINQQKIARSYFYYRLQNNSMFPQPGRDGVEQSESWQFFGMQIMGWAETFQGSSSTPVAPCFKLKLPLGTVEDDGCEESYSEETTQFIRVATVYGVCGATMENQSGQKVRHPQVGTGPIVVSGVACQITN